MPAAGVAAFDVDGTLLAHDSFLPFLVRVKGYRCLGRAIVGAGPSALRSTGERDAVKEALIGQLLRGCRADRLAVLGEAYGAELAGRLRPDMVERIAWHRHREHRLVLVSASLDVYLEPLGRLLGFDGVLATGLEVGADGLLTGRLEGPNCRGREKEIRLRRWLRLRLGEAAAELWAYGDSAGDRELLAMADHPTLVGRRRPWATKRPVHPGGDLSPGGAV